jgi:hypothetical protein
LSVTSNDIANQAIQYMGGNQPPVTGQAPNFDNSAAGVALSKIYSACVATVARQFEWDMARSTVSLTLSGNPAPFPWIYEYKYPLNGIEVWQLAPATLADPNNPLPTTWVVTNAVVSGQQQRVIQTNLQNAVAIYNNNPNENTWDASFREAVVRLLASELAMALAGKPDTSAQLLQSGSAFEAIAEGRDG